MKIFAKVQVICDFCGCSSDFFPHNLSLSTVSFIKSEARKDLRSYYGWLITRDDRAYCPDCVKRLRLRKHKNEHEYIVD